MLEEDEDVECSLFHISQGSDLPAARSLKRCKIVELILRSERESSSGKEAELLARM